jgi:dihydrofolate synthase/folylpolyglutamate synthase
VDYAQASEWLLKLTNPERTGLTRRFGRRMNLDATWRLMELLGNPHEQIHAVHIAGTKGKGSVAAMIESVLRTADYRTGLFTSPHLVSWRERIRIDGRCISEQQVADLAEEVRPAVEQVEAEGLRGPSFFEALTAMGMLAFSREGLDVCVLETGLGGRLDATNVVTPALSIITTLGLDHTSVLGDTLPEIATQKAGIIKPDVPVVVAPQPESIERLMRRKAASVQAPITFATAFTLLECRPLSPDESAPGELPRIGERVAGEFGGVAFEASLPLSGRHQAVNAAVAGRACEMLRTQGMRLPLESFTRGLEEMYWPARVELVGTHPWEVIDCAHNQASARALMNALSRHLQYDRMILVLGASKDKPVEAMAQELASADHAILTEASLLRALPVEHLAERTASAWRSFETIIAPTEALDRARELAGPRDLICVTGSVFVVGELMEEGRFSTRLCGL